MRLIEGRIIKIIKVLRVILKRENRIIVRAIIRLRIVNKVLDIGVKTSTSTSKKARLIVLVLL